MLPQDRQQIRTALENVSGEDITFLQTLSDEPEWQELLTQLARSRAIEELQKLSSDEAHQVVCSLVEPQA